MIATFRLLFDPEAEGASELLSRVIFSFDMRNAFNSIDRRVVVSEVAARIPALLPWVRLMYCRKIRLTYSVRHGTGPSPSLPSAPGTASGKAMFSAPPYSPSGMLSPACRPGGTPRCGCPVLPGRHTHDRDPRQGYACG